MQRKLRLIRSATHAAAPNVPMMGVETAAPSAVDTPARFPRRLWAPKVVGVLALLLNSGLALFAQEGPFIENLAGKSNAQIAREVAPYVYFHQHENNLPVSINKYLSYAHLRRKSDNADLGSVDTEENLFTALKNNNLNSWDTYLDIPDQVYDDVAPGTSDLNQAASYIRVFDRPQGKLLKNERGETILSLGPHKEIQFWFFFGATGCQTHRTVTGNPFTMYDDYTRHFQICDTSRTQGDLEAITVFINTVTSRPMGLGTTRLGQAVYTAWGLLKKRGNRAVVYSAWGSHNMYTTEVMNFLTEDMRDLREISIEYRISHPCKRPDGTLSFFVGEPKGGLDSWHLIDWVNGENVRVLDPERYKNNIVEHALLTGITRYRGNWGRLGLDNRTTHEPSEWGKVSNNGRDIIPYFRDGWFSDCFAKIAPILVQTNRLSPKALMADGPEWFSRKDWVEGMQFTGAGR